jgi:hypothetical protein
MKAQSNTPAPTAQIQWPTFPHEVLYKLSEDGAQALQKWHYDLTYTMQRELNKMAVQIQQLQPTPTKT